MNNEIYLKTKETRNDMQQGEKILLTSDLHLGIEESPVLEELRLKTFKKIISIAKEHDILLIAGDLFHDVEIKKSLIDIVEKEFQKLNNSKTIILLTHGKYNPTNYNKKIYDNLNITHSFNNTETVPPFEFIKNNNAIYIYGGMPSNELNLHKINKIDKNGFHIGLFYTNFEKEGATEKQNSLSLKHFKDLKLDFYALGHNHSFRIFKFQNKIIAAYPGIPEPITEEDTGDRYVISLLLNNSKIEKINRIPVNTIKYTHTILTCDDKTTIKDLENEIIRDSTRIIKQKITITGYINFNYDSKKLTNEFKDPNSLEIVDNSEQLITKLCSDLKDEDSLKGNFYNKLEQILNTKPNINKKNITNTLTSILKKIKTLEDIK